VLDLLFGEGHIKESLHPQRYSSKNMYGYGYGLEGYGEGYRYPELPPNFIGVPIKTKSGGTIVKYVRIPTRKWAAAYFLNKKAVEKNDWVKFMRSKMDQLRNEYYQSKNMQPPERVPKIRHKAMVQLVTTRPELMDLANLPEDELIKAYYEGAIPRSRKLREKLYPILELPESQPKK
jgi:hypothetical protein